MNADKRVAFISAFICVHHCLNLFLILYPLHPRDKNRQAGWQCSLATPLSAAYNPAMNAADSPANHEIEVKFAVTGHQAVSDALRREGGRYLGSFEQTDRFYDTPQGRLRDGGCGLRIRQWRRLDATGGEIDTRPQVTFKGPRRTDSRAKVRPEYQTHLDDPQALEKVFEACGLVGTVVVRKVRTSYRLGECMVELDELADIGCFVEVEGPDEPAIFAVCQRLGLAGEPVSESYLAMVLRRG